MSDTEELLVRVEAPHFVAGIVMLRDSCVRAAPILRWALGYDRATLSAYFREKGWKATVTRVPLGGGRPSLGGEGDPQDGP